MNTAQSATEVAAHHHRRAVRFFWGWLGGTTLVSLAGNVTHAWLMSAEGLRWLSAAVAAVPPTVLLCAVHGVALLAKFNGSGWIYRASVTATAGLALGAFSLSFVALRDLAVLAGVAPGLAVIFPVVVDTAVAVATAALVAVGDKPASCETRNATTAATASAPRAATSSAARAAPTRAAAATPRRVGHAFGADESTSQLAAELVAAKTTRQPVETVAAILAADAKGDPLNRIAAHLGVHHSAVKRVLAAADAHRQAQGRPAA